MKYKKSLLILIMAIFLVSIAGVCASDANDTSMANEDSNQIKLSSGNEMSEDNLQTSEENNILTLNDDETVSAQTDSERLSEGNGTYEDLINEIGDGGDKILTKSYYYYTGGDTIEIKKSGVINGNGAIINMAGSTIRAFTVSASDVTIRNLTIKNVDFNGDGGAIYFSVPGTVENCTFLGNHANGGAMYEGTAINCKFIENHANGYGGAINGHNHKSINCTFIGNTANQRGGALSGGEAYNCNFTNNTATVTGGAMYEGTAINCKFIENQAGHGGAMEGGSAVNCTFNYNTAYNGGAIYLGSPVNCTFNSNSARNGGGAMYRGSAVNCTFNSNSARDGGAMYESSAVNCTFTGNSANYDGGAMYGNRYTAAECTFINNTAKKGNGGATYQITANNCQFTNNTATQNGGAMYGGVVAGSNFTRNHADQEGGAVYDALVGSCVFENCSATNGGAMSKGLTSHSRFNNNSATNCGGAIYNANVSNDTVFNNNNAPDGADTYNVTWFNPQNIKTFRDLNELINNNDNTTIILKNNYTFDFSTDFNFKEGITINRAVTVYGNGFTLNGDNAARIFTVTDSNVIFKDIFFVNGKPTGNGGAINGQCTAINCTFNSNSARNGGAIDGGSAVNCTFNSNSASSSGGAINGGSAVNCTFNHNSAYYGGAMYSGSAVNCTFNSNSADYGGAMYNGSAVNCTFNSNSASSGGAINGGSAVNCTFTGNSASKYGGAMNGGSAVNCTFNSNSASSSGGAMYSGSAVNCTFNSNSAHLGGAMTGGSAVNCTFTGNSATDFDGGAMSGGSAMNCNFTNNTAKRFGGAMNGGAAVLCIFNTFSDTLYNTALPTFSVSKSLFRFDSGEKLLFNLTYDNKNYDGYNTTITLTKDGNPVGVYYALSGSDEGWYVDLSPGIYKATLSMELYSVNPVTVYVTKDVGAYSVLSGEIGSGGGIINLLYNYYFYDEGSSIEITTPNTVINGNGAVINMDGSRIRAFTVSASGVTIKNLTIKNANYAGNGGAIYFTNSGSVENCNFNNNTAGDNGSAINFAESGTVTNCNFNNNTAGDNGGAINFAESGTITNCNFTNNKATNYGGAVNMISGTITNCNFNNNTAGDNGGAINFAESGTITNCNFTNNKATNYGGAVNMISGTITNCNFNNNTAGDNGGAVNMSAGNVTNCNFTDNYALNGGAIKFNNNGTVINCNFINNKANDFGGAINFDGNSAGEVRNCNFTNNSAYTGGAIFKDGDVNVVNCNFNNNKATNYGGAIKMYSGVVENCNFTNNQVIDGSSYGGAVHSSVYGLVINCNFADNNAVRHGRAIYGGVADTCIFKPYSDATYNTRILTPTLNVDDFTTAYGSGEKLTFDLKTNSSMSVGNGNILISVYKINGSWFGNYSCLSGEGWTVDLPLGSYYAIYDTEYIGSQAINRTITINKGNSDLNISDVTLDYGTSTNVMVTTRGAIGITAKINDENITVINNFTIPISGLNAGTYTLTVTTIPDANHVAVTKTANITVNKADSTLTVGDIVFDYKASGSCEVSFANAKGVNASVINQPNAIVNVTNNTITVSGLDAGTYTLAVTTIADENYNNITRNATITVNKLKTQLATTAITTTYNINKDLVITLKDTNGNPLSGTEISVDLNGVKKYTTDNNGQIKVSTKGLAAKAYTAKITFNANAHYDKSAKDVKVTVKKATPKMTAKKATLKAKTKTKKYAVTLKDNTGKAMNKVQITLKVKGKTYKATTNAKGKATFKIKKLTKKGTYKATVTFKGNSNYNKVTKKVKIAIK